MSWVRETFYIIADSPEHALRLSRAKLAKEHPEDPDDPDDGELKSMAHISDEVIEDSVPG